MTSAQRHEQRRTEYDKARADDPIRQLYKSKRWAELRRKLYVERNARCECCGCLTVLHKREANEFTPVAEFDHVKGARERPDMFWSEAHIRLLCHPCHSRRTAKDQGFARG